MIGKGADLEASIEAFLVLHGYRCRRNAVLTGRSGARHEVDVLAERSDGVTSYLLGVECKAWNLPIEKDVVAKLAFVIGDLGLHKGIVVSLEGWRLGAEQSAGQLGIELWGPAELEARLGQVALAQLRSGPARRLGTALPLRCAPDAAERLVGRQSRGRLGLDRETVEWVRAVWVPHHLVEIVTAERERGFLQRPALRSRWRWNLYDGVAGQLASSSTEKPVLVEGELGTSIPPAVPGARVVAAIRKAAQRREEVATASARGRYERQLTALGIPSEAVAVTVEGSHLVHHPFYLGLLRRDGRARLVAVDGTLGIASPGAGAVLTGALGYVLAALQ